MKILQVHKYLYRRAGAEAYMLALAQLLASHGHEVALWGTDHNPPRSPLNLRGESKGDYQVAQPLVGYLNFDRREGVWKDMRKFGHMIWSREAAAKFEAVLKRWKPDVVHIHNIYHHISPSILLVAARLRVPLVMTVHDWHLINPNYTLFDHGKICERQGVRAVFHRCIKDSYLMTLADVKEAAIHRALRVYEKHVAKFLAPAEFVKRKLVAHGMDDKKIKVVPLTVGYSEARPPSRRRPGLPYILFAGRLTEGKGIYLLLEIAKQLPEIQFKIAGTGPEFENVKLKMQNEKLLNVELLGFLEKVKLQSVIDGARIVIVPSQWFEVSPLSVLEAMAAGKVVVASRIGGIPELIEDGKTGFLIEPYKAELSPAAQHKSSALYGQWVDKIKKIYYDETLLKRVGKSAAEYVKRVHSKETHYEKIMEIYNTLRR